MKKTALVAALLVPFLSSCGRKTSKPGTGPFVDSAGARSESNRADLHFLLASPGSDSVGNTRAAADLRESVHGSLERDARAYRDSMRVDGGSAAWTSERVDWRETWLKGEFDRPALALALVRSLVDTGASLLEWNLSDSLRDTLSLGVVYQIPGAYGGTIDSARLGVAREGVVRATR